MQKGLYLHPCIRFIMKISAITLIVQLTLTGMLFANSASSQDLNKIQLNLKLKNAGLKECFQTLQKQTGLKFSFGEALIKKNNKKISISARQISVEKALKLILEETNLRCIQIGDDLIIDEKPAPPKPATPLVERIATGTVTADDVEGALPGVTVQLKGTNKRTVTNSEGKYSISVDNDQSVLIFSYMGYLSQEVTIGNSAVLNIVLKTDRKSLGEIVVIGYGTAKKQDLSSAVSSVPDIEKAKDRPVLSVGAMLQGKVPGVTAINNGGHPNGSPSITIRGTGSRENNSNVLYVVDGVLGAPYNPADIESITILKDAASAAIYGAFSGSGGVILITTRQAAQGKPSVEYSGFTGIKNAWRLPQSLTAADEAKVSNLAYTNAGLDPLGGWDAKLNPYAQVTRTDWVDEIFRTGLIQRHNVSINAGTEKFSNLIQGRYEKEEGTLLNTYNKNLSLRFNSNYQFNKNIKLRQELFWNNNDNRGTDASSGYSGSILSAIYMPRSATPYYEDGTFGGVGPRDSKYLGIHGDAINPVATLLRNQPYNKSNDLQSVTELSVSEVIKGLTVLSRFSYRQTNSLYKNFEPRRTEPGKPNDQNTLSYSTNKGYTWIWENTANYSRVFNRHTIGAMVSTTAQENGARGFSAGAKGFDNEKDWAQFFINAGIFDQIKPADYDYADRNISYVGRLSYSWADRYFLTGSYRYDNAGRLAASNRLRGFPAVTAAWKISSEPFFDLPAVNLFKLRASWGRVGNLSSIPLYYGYLPLASNYTYQVGNGAPQTNAMYVGSLYNPNLSWETSEQYDLGADLSLFNNKLSITADYFNKLTFDLIKNQDTEWTNTFGFGAPTINQGRIRNTGFEVAANWKNNAGALTYDVGANIATLKNRVDYIDQNPNSYWAYGDSWRGVLTPYRSVVGQPAYSYWLIKNEGIFQSDAEANAYVKDGKKIQPEAKAGDLKFRDLNNDGKIDDADRSYMGSAFPKITYGFTTNLAWKNFDFSLFLQGVSGAKLFHAFKQSTLNGSEQGYNRWDKILDAWSPTNTGSDIPKISASDKNKNFQTPSDWYLESGDYLRIKSVLLGYTFAKMPFNGSLRVFVSADNLLTFTNYSGMDPEVGGVGLDGGQYPLSRIYSLGLKLKF